VKRPGALAVCATLERRATAAARAALAQARRLEVARIQEQAAASVARMTLAREPGWPSDICGLVDRRSARARIASDSLSIGVAKARASARAHDAERRRWAQLVRGLERRAVRRAQEDAAWDG